jgi:hypothetical protein
VWSNITYVRASQTTETDLYLPAADSCGGTSSARNASMRFVRRVVELPVLVVLARAERAGIAAAHRDHDVGRLHDLVRERLGELLRDVDPAPARVSRIGSPIGLRPDGASGRTSA